MNLGIYIVNKCIVKFIFDDNKYGEFDVEMQQKMTLNNIALTTGDVMTFEDFIVVNGRFCPQSVRNFCPIVAGFNAGTYKVPACVL